MNESQIGANPPGSQLEAAIEIVEAIYGSDLAEAHVSVVVAVLAAIRANHADAASAGTGQRAAASFSSALTLHRADVFPKVRLPAAAAHVKRQLWH